jgi:hypothetical protein
LRQRNTKAKQCYLPKYAHHQWFYQVEIEAQRMGNGTPPTAQDVSGPSTASAQNLIRQKQQSF